MVWMGSGVSSCAFSISLKVNSENVGKLSESCTFCSLTSVCTSMQCLPFLAGTPPATCEPGVMELACGDSLGRLMLTSNSGKILETSVELSCGDSISGLMRASSRSSLDGVKQDSSGDSLCGLARASSGYTSVEMSSMSDAAQGPTNATDNSAAPLVPDTTSGLSRPPALGLDSGETDQSLFLFS